MATVANHEEHVVVESLTYAELLKNDCMEEEADSFALYFSLLQVAMGIKLTSRSTVYDSITYK